MELDGKNVKVAVKNYQINHITQSVIHVDFIKLEKNKHVKFKIPIYFVNKSKSIAIKKGAVLNIVSYSVILDCLYDEIPPYFIVDLENSDVLHRYYVENLDVPKSAKILKPGQLLANFKGKRGQALKSDAPAA
jgi:large subunit ribosomal protein L25